MSDDATVDRGTDLLRSRVLDALNKGGYALEMRTAAKARKAGAHVVGQSHYYTDIASGKSREIDVVAHWMSRAAKNESWVHLFMAIECKSKPSPWVIFDNPSASSDRVRNFGMTVSRILPPAEDPNDDAILKKLQAEVKDSQAVEDVRRTLFTPTECDLGNGIAEVPLGSSAVARPNDTDKAWSAVQSAMSAARGMRADHGFEGKLGFSGQALVILYVPVVVTSGILFRSWLNESDELDLAEIERGAVRLPIGTNDQARCLVATESGFDGVLSEAQNTVDLFK